MNGDDNRVYEWNALMQLTRVQGAANATYRYDAQGHQIGKTTNGEAISYLVDAHNPTGYRQVIESKSGGKLSQNIFGNDLILTNSNTKKSYYHADKLGTVRATSNAAGNLVANVGYGSAYGQSLLNKDHYGFTGERFDSNANALYLRARYYDPKVGSFLSRDTYSGTYGNPLSRNRYLYTHANPVNGIDPSGNIPTLAGQLAAIGERAKLALARAAHNVHRVRRINAKLCSIGAKLALPYKKLKVVLGKGSPFQAHHVFQDALARGAVLNYNRMSAIAIPLLGGTALRGGGHRETWLFQIGEGKLPKGSSMQKMRKQAYDSLRLAGCRNKDATEVVQFAEKVLNLMDKGYLK